jgi:hypothetical protein
MMSRAVWMLAACLIPGIAFAASTETPRVSVFEKALNVILASVAPQMSVSLRERTIKGYEDGKANKGQAIELIRGSPWRSEANEDQAVTGDRTLEACQLRNGKPCALIAVNEEIAADGELISKDMPRLHYVGEFDLAKIPIIRLATRNRSDVQNYFAAAQPKAMAIHPWGKLFISQGGASIKEAEEAALAKCNNDPDRDGKDGGCFLYASNNDVVLSRRLMSSQ